MEDNVQVRFGAQTGDLDSKMDQVRAEFAETFKRMESAVEVATSNIEHDISAMVREVTADMRHMSGAVSQEMGDMSRQMSTRLDGINTNSKTVIGSIGGIKGALVGLAAGYGMVELSRYTVGTIVEFERLRAILTTLEGENAGARFQSLKQFATETPYDLQQVVTAFTKLKAQGLDPSNDALRDYGNIASAMGKSLNDIVEAATDAAVGEMERLKEFGIKARQQGDEITFMFKGQTTTVKRNSEEIQKYLRSIGSTDFAGAMERQMDTLGGAFSNLGDAVASFADDVGTGGLASALNDVTQDMVSATGEAGNFATMLGEFLGTTIRAVWDIIKGFGEAVSQIFDALGDIIREFTGTTKSNGQIWSFVFKSVLAVINGFGVGVRVVFNAIAYVVRTTTDTILTFARIVVRALSLDLSGAVEEYRRWGKRMEETARTTANNVVNALAEGKKRQDAIFADKPKEKSGGKLEEYKPPKPTPSTGGGSGGGKDKMQRWQDELRQRIEAEVGFFKNSTALELDFWKSKLATVSAKSKEAIQIRGQIYQLEKAMATEALNVELENFDNRQDALRDDMAAQIAIQEEKIAALARTYGTDSQQYRQALQEKVRMQRDFDQELVSLAREKSELARSIAQTQADSENAILQTKIDAQRQAIEDASELGQLNPQERLNALAGVLAQEQALELAHAERVHQIKYNSIKDDLAIQNLREPDRRRLLGELELLEAEHVARMAEIRASQAAQMQAFNSTVAKDAQQQWRNALAPIGQAFNGMLQNMAIGMQSFRSAFIGALDQLFSQFITSVVNMGVQWAAMELSKTTATTAGVATRTAAEATGAAASSSINIASGLKTIAIKAVEAAAGAYAAIASIPVVGPFLAPAAAAAALYGVYSLGKGIASASGGYDIPSGVNPMTQLHEEEMVLPKHIANPLRSMLAGAGPRVSALAGRTAEATSQARTEMSSRSSETTFNYQPKHTNMGADFDTLLKKDGRALRRWLRNEVRNGSLSLS